MSPITVMGSDCCIILEYLGFDVFVIGLGVGLGEESFFLSRTSHPLCMFTVDGR